MKSLTIVVILVFGIGAKALAATFDIPLKGLDAGAKILVNVNEAQITAVHAPNSKSLKISLFEAANEEYMVQSNSSLIEIRSRSSDREQFGMKPTAKKRVIEIRGPSMALEIHAFEGSINITGWDKEAVLHLQKGRLAAKNGKGSLALHSQTGEISVLDHQGRVEIDTYKSNITLKNLNGDADLENFSGETLVEKASGALNLRQGQGSAKVIAGNGALQFDLVRGSLTAQKFQGRIEGVTLDGPVSVTMTAENDVNVRAQTAKVTVQSPANSGAALNLSTMEGDLTLPQNLKASRDGTKKSYRGRLKGADQKGSISIRSQEGLILIR